MDITTKVNMLAAGATGNATYDMAAKKLFMNPEILSPLLQEVIPEYKGYSAEEVLGFIIPETVETEAVDDQSRLVEKLPTEDGSVSEKLVQYDIRFRAKNPKLRRKDMQVSLILNLEIQNVYRPRIKAAAKDGKKKTVTYPLMKRAIYYAARQISSQLGVLTKNTNYGDLQKVYSIWICNGKVPKKLQGTVTEYSFCRKNIVGRCEEPEEDFDLMTVVMVRRGGKTKETKEKVFDYLNGVFDADIEKVAKYIPRNQNFGRIMEGVSEMEGLGQLIADENFAAGKRAGRVEGKAEGKAEGMAEVRFNNIIKWLSADKDPEDLKIFGYTDEEIEAVRSQMKE